MAKKPGSTEFQCGACGRREAKWLGRCPECGEWNSFREVSAAVANSRSGADDARPLPLATINSEDGIRLPSGMGEMDRVLGGGIMKGSVVLVGGEPGIGKSTLMLQLIAKAETKGRLLYVSGEESPGQVKMRADRIGAVRDGIELLCTGSLSRTLSAMEELKPVIVVVDSVQTLHSPEAGSVPGTVNQMKYCGAELADWAKSHGAAVFLVAHVTKEGIIAGPKALEHLVDAVLYFEQADSDLRFLRSAKNRFGGTDELGLFRMGEAGLEEVPDASELFIVRRKGPTPSGTCVSPIYEGSRPLLVEIQALTVASKTGLSRVYSDKIDSQRVARIAAVLEKQTGLRFSDQDIYVNVAGGIKTGEVGVELALACALYSARTGASVPSGWAVAGELSLAGEVRSVRQMRKRAKAAKNSGFPRVLGPTGAGDEQGQDGDWEGSPSLKDALSRVFGFKLGTGQPKEI
jgi:DNA repair protein RadA/Sms